MGLCLCLLGLWGHPEVLSRRSPLVGVYTLTHPVWRGRVYSNKSWRERASERARREAGLIQLLVPVCQKPSARPQTHRIATFYAICRFTSPLRSPSSRPPIASMDRVAAEAGKPSARARCGSGQFVRKTAPHPHAHAQEQADAPPARSTVQKACKACYTAKVRECLND